MGAGQEGLRRAGVLVGPLFGPHGFCHRNTGQMPLCVRHSPPPAVGEVRTLSELGRRQALPVRAWGGRHYTLHPAEPSVGLPVFIKCREWSGKSKGPEP